jgi:LmbE family N-acetylglucosaminyl deacetylase
MKPALQPKLIINEAVKPSGKPASLASRYAGYTVLAIGAHPDDLEIAVGGTLARFARDGARVVMAIVSIPADFDTRCAEARRAAEILGCELRLLVEDDCKRIDDIKSYQLVSMLDALVRELEPAALLTHSATEFHRDHVAVHNACVSTQRLKAFDLFHFNPTMVRPVPVAFYPRAYVDVSETIELKMQAIEAHSSQFGSRGLDSELYRDVARVNGRMVGVKYAEGLDVGRMLLA